MMFVIVGSPSQQSFNDWVLSNRNQPEAATNTIQKLVHTHKDTLAMPFRHAASRGAHLLHPQEAGKTSPRNTLWEAVRMP
jgi:hypothetical protein